MDSKKVVLREIRIETNNQIGELKHQWRAQIDIIYLAMFGILPIDATKENFC